MGQGRGMVRTVTGGICWECLWWQRSVGNNCSLRWVMCSCRGVGPRLYSLVSAKLYDLYFLSYNSRKRKHSPMRHNVYYMIKLGWNRCNHFIQSPFQYGLPGGTVVKNLPANTRDTRDPWAGEVPWGRKWLPTPVFFPGKFHGHKSLVGYSPWGHKELDMAEWWSRTFISILSTFIPLVFIKSLLTSFGLTRNPRSFPFYPPATLSIFT